MAEESGTGIRWVPLESNPEVMTKYSRQLGATTGEWVDVFGLDDDILQTVPKPVQAVVLLFPISDEYDNFCKEEDAKTNEKEVSKNVFYLKQYVGNACGTVGVLHSLGNNVEALKLADGSILSEFIKSTADMTPEARGDQLGKFNGISTAHEEAASEGDTTPPPVDEKIVTHFVAFVHKDGSLYELDGRRARPINHGPTTADDLLKDAAVVCRARMARDPTEYRFTIMALTTGEL